MTIKNIWVFSVHLFSMICSLSFLPSISDVFIQITWDELRGLSSCGIEGFQESGFGTYENPFVLADLGKDPTPPIPVFMARKACEMLIRLRKENTFSQFYYGQISFFDQWQAYDEHGIQLHVDSCSKICEMPCSTSAMPPCDIEFDTGSPPALEATSILEKFDKTFSICTDIPQHPDLYHSASLPIMGHLIYEIKWLPTNMPLSECGDIVELSRDTQFGPKILRFVVISALGESDGLSVGNSLVIPEETCIQLCGAENCAGEFVKQECRIVGHKVEGQDPVPHQANKISFTYSVSSLDLVTPCFNVLENPFLQILAASSHAASSCGGHSNGECSNVYMFRKKHSEDRFLYGMVSKYLLSQDGPNIVALGIDQETCEIICSTKCELENETPCEIDAFPAELNDYLVFETYSLPNPNNCPRYAEPLPQFTVSGIALDPPLGLKSNSPPLECGDYLKIVSASETWYIRVDASYSNNSTFLSIPNEYCYRFCKDGCLDNGSLACLLEATKVDDVESGPPQISRIQNTFENLWEKLDPCLIPPPDTDEKGDYGDYALAGAVFTNYSTPVDHSPQNECGNMYMFRKKNSSLNFRYVKIVGFLNFPPGNDVSLSVPKFLCEEYYEVGCEENGISSCEFEVLPASPPFLQVVSFHSSSDSFQNCANTTSDLPTDLVSVGSDSVPESYCGLEVRLFTEAEDSININLFVTHFFRVPTEESNSADKSGHAYSLSVEKCEFLCGSCPAGIPAVDCRILGEILGPQKSVHTSGTGANIFLDVWRQSLCEESAKIWEVEICQGQAPDSEVHNYCGDESRPCPVLVTGYRDQWFSQCGTKFVISGYDYPGSVFGFTAAVQHKSSDKILLHPRGYSFVCPERCGSFCKPLGTCGSIRKPLCLCGNQEQNVRSSKLLPTGCLKSFDFWAQPSFFSNGFINTIWAKIHS